MAQDSFGWIKADVAIDHKDAGRREGKLFVPWPNPAVLCRICVHSTCSDKLTDCNRLQTWPLAWPLLQVAKPDVPETLQMAWCSEFASAERLFDRFPIELSKLSQEAGVKVSFTVYEVSFIHFV